MPSQPERHPEHVQSLARGLAVIRAFSGEHRPLSLTEVARRCDLTRAAARRFLLTLVDLGYIAHDGRNFMLRPRVLELGVAYLSGLGFLDVARPHLEAVSHALDESASISTLDGDEIVYIARVPTRRIMSVTIANGTRFPARATSMGRVLLAALPADEADERLRRAHLNASDGNYPPAPSLDSLRSAVATAREDGHAVADQELEEGLRSIAVPVRDGGGITVAAMNVATHAARRSVEDLRSVALPRLEEAAQAIHADLVRLRATA